MEDNRWSTLMEQNWKRMHVILDKELPVKNKKRKNLLFFIAFASISFAIFLLLLLSDFTAKTRNVQNMADPIFANNSLSEKTYLNNSDTLCNPELTIWNSKSAGERAFTTRTNKSYTSAKVYSIKKGINSVFNLDQPKNSHVDVITENTISIDNTLTNTNRSFESNVISNTLFIEELTNLIYSIESNQKKELTFQPLNCIQVTPKDGWHYGIKVALSFNKISSPQQFCVGMFTNKSIGKTMLFEGKFGLKNFNRYSSFLRQSNIVDSNTNDVMGSSVASAENVFNLDSKTLTNNTIDYVNENIIQSTLTSAQYFESGISIGFRINNHMLMKGGLSVGRFLHATYRIDNSSRSIYTAFSNTQNLDNLDLNQADNLLKKWITNGFIEADFSLSQRCSLTSGIMIGVNNNVLDYSDTAFSSLETSASANLNPILFKQPEKGTINFNVGVNYYLK